MNFDLILLITHLDSGRNTWNLKVYVYITFLICVN